MSKPIVTNCKIEGCMHPGNKDSNTGKRYYIGGYCYMHYRRNKKYGSPYETRFIVDGRTSHPLYRIHSGMLSRCYTKSDNKYEDYGGRGIKVCDRWRNAKGFLNFLDDMGNRPTPKHSIDRIDVNGDYEPNNCRWATIHQQASNKRNNTAIPGVSWDVNRNKWAARLNVNKEKVLNKRFNSLKDAVAARQAAEDRYLNFDATH